jgi:NTP pyrophosphatase (non-canonical NTP hydrolase)
MTQIAENMADMGIITERMIHLAERDPKSLSAMVMKLMEEVGELAEATNHKLGNLPHKEMKEPIEGEVADVINCAITVLVKAYPEEQDWEIYERLYNQLIRKADKWANVIKALRPDK